MWAVTYGAFERQHVILSTAVSGSHQNQGRRQLVSWAGWQVQGRSSQAAGWRQPRSLVSGVEYIPWCSTARQHNSDCIASYHADTCLDVPVYVAVRVHVLQCPQHAMCDAGKHAWGARAPRTDLRVHTPDVAHACHAAKCEGLAAVYGIDVCTLEVCSCAPLHPPAQQGHGKEAVDLLSRQHSQPMV